MFKNPDDRRRCSRWLLLILLLILPSTFDLLADDGRGEGTPASEEVHPWDADVLGFQKWLHQTFVKLFRNLFASETPPISPAPQR